MTALVDQAIGMSVVLTGALAACFALRRRSAALRHWVIAAGLMSTLALPAARLLVPAWSVVSLPAPIQAGSVSIAPAPPGAPLTAARADGSRVSAPPLGVRVAAALLILWAVGSAANLLLLFAGIGRLLWHARHARVLRAGPWRRAADRIGAEMRLRRPPVVLETRSASMLGAWGWRHPRVLLPRGTDGWPDADVDVVMRHELAHVGRRDWMIQLVAEVVRSVHWFNPLAWIACARLRLESERACDDQVLVAGVRGDDYATRLLDLAARLRPQPERWNVFPAPGMAQSTSLRRRVVAMLNPALSRTSVSARSRLVISALVLAFTLPVAGLVVLAQGHDRFFGTILDPSGKNVANARIVLTQDPTGVRRELRSDGAGRFEFGDLQAGNYDMEVSLPGFMTVKGTITVAPGGLARDIKLQLGTLQETIVVSSTPSAPASNARARREPPQSTPCVAGPTGGNVRAPIKLTDERPAYPEALVASKVAGTVVAEGILAGDGTIRDLRIIQSPHPALGASVVAAVEKWRFTPTMLNCEPADIRIGVNVKFVLD